MNFNDTFRVEDGLLKVRYDKWTGFNGEFGHIFYKRPFSYYLVAAEYRFNGVQVAGAGPGLAWALRNNGIMAHGQSAAEHGAQPGLPDLARGAAPRRPRSRTAHDGEPLHAGHERPLRRLARSRATASTPRRKTFDGDQWVRVEFLALGDSIMKHIANGDTVMTYRKPQMGGGSANNTKPGVLVPGKPITGGSISLQAETAEIDFRKVEVLNLEGCMDPKSSSYQRILHQARSGGL